MSTIPPLPEPDRYISFCGIDCDRQAESLMAHLDDCLNRCDSASPWRKYFERKLKQKQAMGHDHLFFIGAQMNVLYEFFEAMDDEKGQSLLWRIEQQCC